MLEQFAKSAPCVVLFATLAAACGGTDPGEPGGDAARTAEELVREGTSVENDDVNLEIRRAADEQSPRSTATSDNPPNRALAELDLQSGWSYAYDELDQVFIAQRGATTVVLDQQALQGLAPPEVNDASGWGIACRAACWGAAGMGCAAVSVTCGVGTTITIGGTTIPCAWAIVAACTASGAGASICSDKFCPP